MLLLIPEKTYTTAENRHGWVIIAHTKDWCDNLSLPWLQLTHWGWVTHICIGKLTIIGSDNGLSPDWLQAIIWTNAGILLIGPLGINFNEISIGIQTFSFKKIHLKMSSGKWRPFCLGLNVLNYVSERGPEITAEAPVRRGFVTASYNIIWWIVA